MVSYQHLLPGIAGIAFTLFSLVGIARVVGWAPSSVEGSRGRLAHERVSFLAASVERAGPRCPECGEIVSIGGNEMIVRMADGSSRAINRERSASWQPGEQVILIDGTDPSRR